MLYSKLESAKNVAELRDYRALAWARFTLSLGFIGIRLFEWLGVMRIEKLVLRPMVTSESLGRLSQSSLERRAESFQRRR
jgi:hypothetical protein